MIHANFTDETATIENESLNFTDADHGWEKIVLLSGSIVKIREPADLARQIQALSVYYDVCLPNTRLVNLQVVFQDRFSAVLASTASKPTTRHKSQLLPLSRTM